MREKLALVPLYVAFAATGVGVALPGVLLPLLLVEWRLADAQGGRLLFMVFLGSSVGALLVQGALRWTLTVGSGLGAIALIGIAASNGSGAWAWFGLFGVGLGMLMTSVSLARQQQAGGGGGTELVRLNLMWAGGASVAPALVAAAIRAGHDRAVLWGLALVLGLTAVWSAGGRELGLSASGADAESQGPFWQVPVGLVVMTMLITGVEAAAGGWLATFARRGGEGLAGMVGAPTGLWVGLLLSRLFWSFDWRRRGVGWLTGSVVVRGSVGLMAVSAALLMVSRDGAMLVMAAGCLGLGIGPVYPLLLAWVLRTTRGGQIFFLAGVGSAVVPWMTGVVSTARGSLRMGLAVPAAGVLVMLGLALMMPLRRLSGEEE